MQADGQLLCAYIGLGACGSAIAEAANVRGFGKAVILNSSSEDLKAATMIQAQSKLKLQSINGAAKSRKIAFDAFKSEYPHFINVVKTTLQEGNSIEDYDIIFYHCFWWRRNRIRNYSNCLQDFPKSISRIIHRSGSCISVKL